jgi:hypothetical protein
MPCLPSVPLSAAAHAERPDGVTRDGEVRRLLDVHNAVGRKVSHEWDTLRRHPTPDAEKTVTGAVIVSFGRPPDCPSGLLCVCQPK